ncbi:hypothetical protein JJL56_07730 [Azospirillum sp. YIM DDC1]|uniref:DUF945 domain-containing protein n=1 Tax=Azospirillum aestuarii TaxID=2802052 RepID=A0ABS1HV90_9PROT|nr:hypothetical protein [Azospirillum aestuarii]MBK4718753.1 hypothetical protein [Azospirillum aestuarii]
MRRIPARPLAAALMLATLALPPATARAEAPPVTEDGARALAAALKDGLARWFPKSGDDETELRWSGEPVATPAGDHYKVALPALTAVSDDGTTADIGTIHLTVKPQDGNTHAVTATLPDRVAILDNGKPSATVKLGRQRISALWSGAYETALSMDAELGDLSVTSDRKGKKGKKDESALTVGAITVAGELKPDGTAAAGTPLWSGPGALSISNLRFLDETKKEVLNLGGLTMEGTYTRVDLARADAMQRLTQAHALAGTQPPAAELIPLMQNLMAGASGRVRLSGLTALNPEDGTRLALGQLVLRGSTEDLDKPMASTTFGIESSGLTLEPEMVPKAFMPDKLDIQLSTAKLPTASLWRAFADLATLAESQAALGEEDEEDEEDGEEEATLPDDGTDEAEMSAIGNRLMGAMAEVGTELRIDRFVVNTPATSGTMTGAMRMAANSAFGAVGSSTVLLRGLDAATKAMQPKPGRKADESTQNALGVIAMLQAFGQASKDDAGNDVRSYKIDVTETGQFLLNGADMSALMGMGQPEPEPIQGKKR